MCSLYATLGDCLTEASCAELKFHRSCYAIPSSSHSLAVTDAITAINVAVLGDSPAQAMGVLKSEFAGISSLDDSCAERYYVALQRARQEKGEVRIPYWVVCMQTH